MRFFYKTFFRCDDTTASGTFERAMFLPRIDAFSFNGLVTGDGTYTSAPVWFTQTNTYPAGEVYFFMTPPEDGETYRFSWDASNTDGSTDEYIIELVQFNACTTPITTQCSPADKRVITWLNREGGWSYFVFTGKTTFETQIPEGKAFEKDFIKRYYDRSKIYNGEIVTTGSIPLEALDLMESLKYSVQAYLIDSTNTLDIRFVPVFLLDGDYTKRKTGDKIFDVSCKFIYAKELVIQTQ